MEEFSLQHKHWKLLRTSYLAYDVDNMSRFPGIEVLVFLLSSTRRRRLAELVEVRFSQDWVNDKILKFIDFLKPAVRRHATILQGRQYSQYVELSLTPGVFFSEIINILISKIIPVGDHLYHWVTNYYYYKFCFF